MKSKFIIARLALLLTASVLFGLPAAAQTFPSKPIRIIASTPPGGTIDLVARVLALHLPAALGQPVIVENKPGAAGNIAADYVARATPDGHTLLVTASSHATNINLYPKLSYDPVKDFAPVSQLTSNVFALAVPAASPANTLGEFLALAKAKKSNLSYGSAGAGQGNHLGMELLKTMAGFDAVHVPYNGTGPVTLALMAGQIDVALQSPPGVIPQSKSGRLKILATTGKTRSPFLPDVPTVAEAGVPGYELLGWIGLLAPAGTPKTTVDTLKREAAKVLSRPDVVSQLHAVSLDVVASTPQEFGAFLNTEIATWAQVIKKSGARAE
ncbi:tripartite tricarboxylate transporter substrate binding protein [Variovorax rhizosphaerae]|uniref:Tripartite tricarboxylate transporter substrate binding protein n=1 Tax=Variovorax rhizosphaerae TaxID=1836200 RepID=A0ABU8WTR2_9BURK